MGSIKNSSAKPVMDETHELTEDEMNYLININAAKQNIIQEYDRVLSAFLHYLASTRFGYAPTDDLQFEVDFADSKRKLKITKL